VDRQDRVHSVHRSQVEPGPSGKPHRIRTVHRMVRNLALRVHVLLPTSGSPANQGCRGTVGKTGPEETSGRWVQSPVSQAIKRDAGSARVPVRNPRYRASLEGPEPRRMTKLVAVKICEPMRRRILELDNWECVNCRSRTGLEVHHIRYRTPCRVEDFVTLCGTCHGELHRFPGFRVNLYRFSKAKERRYRYKWEKRLERSG